MLFSSASLPRSSLVIPSARYESAESPRFSKGSTASTLVPEAVPVSAARERQAKSTPSPSRKPTPRVSASTGIRRGRCGRLGRRPARGAGRGGDRGGRCRLNGAGEIARGGEPVGGHRRQRALDRL